MLSLSLSHNLHFPISHQAYCHVGSDDVSFLYCTFYFSVLFVSHFFSKYSFTTFTTAQTAPARSSFQSSLNHHVALFVSSSHWHLLLHLIKYKLFVFTSCPISTWPFLIFISSYLQLAYITFLHHSLAKFLNAVVYGAGPWSHLPSTVIK